jgi:hypothetical protein
MKAQVWLSFLSIAALLVGCSSDPERDQAQSPSSPSPVAAAPAQQFANPVVTQAPVVNSNPATAVPGLLQPTNATARIPSIVVGRRDPFAMVPSSVPPVLISTNSSPATKVAVSPLPPPTANGARLPATAKLPPITLPPLAANSPLGPLPTFPNSAALPPVNVPSAAVAPPSRTSLADAIEVSGVVQVGGKWNVIVKEPNATSSRYVAVGEYLENGKVLVKQIVATDSSTPVVVLQQNGVEIRKSVV